MKTLLKISFLLNCLLLVGCANQGPLKADNFMKNTPKQVTIGKLPYTNEVGVLYEI